MHITVQHNPDVLYKTHEYLCSIFIHIVLWRNLYLEYFQLNFGIIIAGPLAGGWLSDTFGNYQYMSYATASIGLTNVIRDDMPL